MTLGEKLLYLRKNKGLSQEQLAIQVLVSRQAISKWELGESLPDTDKVVKLTKIFDVTADFFLNDEIDIPVGLTDEDIIQSMLEKEPADNSDRLALKMHKQKTPGKTWVPILFSGLTLILVVILYLLFFR